MQLTSDRIEQIVGFLVLGLLAAGCLVIILPFVAPILWALILALTTWPAFQYLQQTLRGRRTLAALAMIVLLVLALLIPVIVLSANLVNESADFVARMKIFFADGLPDAPGWLTRIPLVGERLAAGWNTLAAGTVSLAEQVPRYIRPVGSWLVGVGAIIGRGLLELCVSLLVLFFFYRDGADAARGFAVAVRRIGGEKSQRLLDVAEGTLTGVVYGVVGTAFAQGLLTGIGLAIADVQGATFLGVVAGFASLIPGGATIVWLPAAIWLAVQGEMAWGIFLAVWGAAIVGTADNVLKPMFISRGSDLPFVLTFLGILGGMLVFGFLGLFIGPTLIALGYTVIMEWMRSQTEAAEAPVPGAGSSD